MAYLHTHQPHPIIHRDLKPSNVLRTHSGVWKVCDFGLSRLLPGKAMVDSYRLTGETGSYVYMAPEVYRHEEYSLKVDQYAFAMIAYQAFQGVRPFEGLRPMDAARAAATGRRPAELGRIPMPVRHLVVTSWSVNPAQRPRFSDVVSELSAFAMERGLNPQTHFTSFANAGAQCAAGCSVM
mmetsp:Transcript_18088/g.44625  ORF Transcript_18088/g.44625 Transcript_18088/m.44625 type:complete len:181 (-) Transcript_18088:249-791(-)